MSSKKQKRAAEKSGAKQAELKKTLATVRGQLTSSEKKLAKAKERTDHWKGEAKTSRTAAARANDQIEKLHKKLDKVSAVQPIQASTPEEAAVSGRPTAEPTTADGVTVPDQTWTVVQLRAEARARGLAGMSNKPKATLLNVLS